jgi:hypothetical protein
MSHVDEGALHAYLDGALDEYPAAEARRVREHVETCAICAERLAEERRVRDDARAILDLAAPKVEVPTFEELRAYVRAGQSKRVAFSRLYKMSWAASVVLALGTGWMIRGSRIDPVNDFRPTESAAPTVSSERALDEVVTTAAPAAREEFERDAATAAQAPAGRTAAEPQSVAEPEQPATDAPVDGAPLRAEVAQAAPPAGAGGAAAAAPAPSTAPALDLAADAVLADAQKIDDAAAGNPAAFGDVVASVDSRQADVSRVQERLDSAARAAESRRRVSTDQIVTSSLDAAAPAAPSLQRAGAANEVERDRAADEEAESLVVPGLEVLTVENLGEGTAFVGTRSLQRLASGDTLEVIHLPEGVEPSLLAPPAVGRNQVVRQHVDGWLVMRAPLSLIELEQLLERLEAAR